MESHMFQKDLLTAHEPLSTVSFVFNELRVRFMESHPELLFAPCAHEPTDAQCVAPASWTAAVLCRFWSVRRCRKRQPPPRRSGALARREDGRTGAVQNLAADRTIHERTTEIRSIQRLCLWRS